jgi:hypothetical protein
VDSLQIDQVQLRLIVLIQVKEEVAGMEVLMHDSRIVHPRQKVAEGDSDALPETISPGLRQFQQVLFEERVQLPCFFQSLCEKETLTPTGAGGNPGGDWRVGRHLPLGHLKGSLILGQGLAGPEPFAQPGASIRDAVLLEEEVQSWQADLIDGAMLRVLDDAGLPVLQPLLQAQSIV